MEAQQKSPSSDNRLSIHSQYHNTPEEYLDCKLQSEVVDASALAANLLPPLKVPYLTSPVLAHLPQTWTMFTPAW